MHLTYSFYLCYLKQTISSIIVFIIMFMYFQGFKDHKLYDPLQNPGSADLTADVDFSYLKRCCGEDGNAVLTLIYNSHFNEACRLSKLFEILVPLFIFSSSTTKLLLFKKKSWILKCVITFINGIPGEEFYTFYTGMTFIFFIIKNWHQDMREIINFIDQIYFKVL